MLAAFVLTIAGGLTACASGSIGASILIGIATTFWILWHTDRPVLAYGYLCGYYSAIGYFIPDAWGLMIGSFMLFVGAQIWIRRFIPQKTLPHLCAAITIFGAALFSIDVIMSLALHGTNIFQKYIFAAIFMRYAIEWGIVLITGITASYAFRAIWPQKTSYLVS